MFSIFASSMMTATRQNDWGKPDHASKPQPPDRRTRTERDRQANDTRRWLSQVGRW